jgi:hypothetical protein
LTKNDEIASRPKAAKRPVTSSSVFIPSRKPSGNKKEIMKKETTHEKPVFVVEESYEDDDDGFSVDPLVSVDFKLASGYIWNLIRQRKGMQLHSAIVDVLNDRSEKVSYQFLLMCVASTYYYSRKHGCYIVEDHAGWRR